MKKDLTIDMLAAVKKPARYTGGEFGSIFKEEAEVRLALACLLYTSPSPRD